ncbi:MAG: hypothetical protein ABUL69_04525, partial [Peristeroidobacter soli]
WMPIWPIAFSCALFITSLVWPPVLDGVSLGTTLIAMGTFLGGSFAMMPALYMRGPLGMPALEDDERDAALRKDSLLFCLGLLAVLNVLGQPVLMILSHWQEWKIAQTVSVVTTAFMLNATSFGCLPTLYASWNLPQLPKD